MGLHFIPADTNIDFVGIRKISFIVSLALLLAGMASMAIKGGPRYGIDFAGGTIVQIQFSEPIGDEEVKSSLEHSNLPGLVVQEFGEGGAGYLLRISTQDEAQAADMREVITSAMQENLPGHAYTVERLETVGPKVGADLRTSAIEALFYATLLIAVYISGRFEQRWTIAVLMALVLGGGIYALGNILVINKLLLILAACVLTVLICWKLKLAFALGAVVSIVHDLLITVGIFSILNKEFDLTIIAALLTVVGYSLNDTIIVFDRIRENLRVSKKITLGTIINRSVNQTISRTVLTSGTTLLVVIALLVLGGDIIFDFALVLLIGVIVGTYSSIFVAAPVLLYFEDNIFIQVAKEKEEKEKEEVRKRNRGLPQV